MTAKTWVTFFHGMFNLSIYGEIVILVYAGMLMKLGQLAKSEANPALTKEAEDLIYGALRLRVNLLLVQPCLWLKWMFPGWTGTFPAIEMPYEELLAYLNRIRQQRQLELKMAS